MTLGSLWTRLIKYALPAAAVLLLAAALFYVFAGAGSDATGEPPSQPTRNPYEQAETVAGAGIVEPKSENIEVASPTAGVVTALHVEVGEQVEQGAPLFTLDTRLLETELAVRQAELGKIQADLAKLQSQPRAEEIPPREAAVSEAEARLRVEQDKLARFQELARQNAISQQDLISQRGAAEAAVATLESVQADLALLKAGAWRYDIAIAEAQVQQAQAAVEEVRTQIDQRTVRAPIAARILQVDIEPGEFVGAPPGESVMILGDMSRLHVRADIDEYDIPRFRRGGAATAVPRGTGEKKYPLRFVRVEPYVVPKTSLTGRNTERVDTRVLQVIYEVEGTADDLYVGQQVDVYVKTEKKGTADSEPAAPRN